MIRSVTFIVYIALGLIAITSAWLLDNAMNQPPVAPTEVKQQTINLSPDDINESKNLKDAVERLSQPVQKPTTGDNLLQLQPATTDQGGSERPQ